MTLAMAPIQAEPVTSTYEYLHELMSCYQLKDLVNVAPDAFTRRIRQLCTMTRWGHHHDFGGFCVPGRMCKHHLSMIHAFVDEIDAMPRNLDGMRVLDIGCWSGGTSLLLCAMGAEVVAVEEVPHYAQCADYLRHAFDLRKLQVRELSLYDCTSDEFHDAFDIVLLAGVLHHLSDPKLALRIVFNSLVDGGVCLVEAVAKTTNRPDLENSVNQLRWNNALFTPDNLDEMMKSVGFEVNIPMRPIQYKTPEPRLYGGGRRDMHVDFSRAGLSVRTIR